MKDFLQKLAAYAALIIISSIPFSMDKVEEETKQTANSPISKKADPFE